MMRALAIGLLVPAGLLGGPAGANGDFPQVKIDFIDSSQAPKIRIGVSLLDSRLRPVPAKAVDRVTLLDAPPRMATEALASASFDRGYRFEDGEEVPDETDTAATLALGAEAEAGLAAVVVVPGYGDPAYQRGSLGARTWGAAGLLFKKLESARQMNILWVGDDVWTWIDARGRTRSLSPLSASTRELCQATRRADRIDGGQEPSDEEADVPDEKVAHCGLTEAFGNIAPMIKETTAQGFYPHLFGLQSPICGNPAHARNPSGSQILEQDGDDAPAPELGPAALEVALQMLIRDASPERDRAILLIGDGRDGYTQPQSECMLWARARCTESETTARARARCVEETLSKVTVAEQERFLVRAEKIIALAKAARVRIFSIVNPLATPAERDRLEVLAWRTGGTARIASDANEVVDRASDLLDELHGQLVLDFVDERAVPGAELHYRARVKVGSATYRTSAMAFQIPLRAGGSLRAAGDLEIMGRARLGNTGFLIAVGVLALILAFVGLKLLKRLAGLFMRKA
jgi:hypothetical protein